MSPITGREVVIVETARTPVGRGHPEHGQFRDLHPSTLLARTFAGLLDRAGVDSAEVDEAIAGCANQQAQQGANIARGAWLEAGLAIETAATTVDNRCGSAQQAVHVAAALIASGTHETVVGGGVEHMTRVSFGDVRAVHDEYGSPFTAPLLERFDRHPQGLCAELMADRWELTRPELDEIALRSHRRATDATEAGRFDREIVPIEVGGATHAADQGIRPDTSLERLAELKTPFREGGRVTAGNSSQISDGAAAVLLTSRERAGELGLTPRARIVDQTTVGVDPVLMLTGPIPATRKLLKRNGMALSDIDLIEINEAFASVVAAWGRELAPDWDRVNVNGGAIALGHPLGSTGARLITTLLHELERADKEIGLVTMCCGGGIGTGTLIERIG